MVEQLTSNQWNTPWRASGFAVYDTSGNLVAHTGITGNRSMHGKQLEMMAAMIAEAVNAYSASEPETKNCRCVRPKLYRDSTVCESCGYPPRAAHEPPEAHWLWVAGLACQIWAPTEYDEGEIRWRVRSHGGYHYGDTLQAALEAFWESEIRSRDLDGHPLEATPPASSQPPEVERLRAALKKYGRHQRDCYVAGYGPKECACGLEQALHSSETKCEGQS